MSSATYNLGPVALIPLGEGRMFDAGGTIVAVFRTRDSRVYALDPWCPHRGGPLADGIVAADRVLCPLHGYAFELRTGRALHHECGPVRSYPVRLNAQDELLVTIRHRRAAAPDDASVLARAADGSPIGGEAIGGEAIGDDAIDAEPVDAEAIEAEATDAKAIHSETIDRASIALRAPLDTAASAAAHRAPVVEMVEADA